MANMKKITEVTLADKVLENDTVLGERDGAAVRLPAGALGGSGGDVVYYVITDNGKTGTVSANMTFDELKAAWQAGKPVLFVLNLYSVDGSDTGISRDRVFNAMGHAYLMNEDEENVLPGADVENLYSVTFKFCVNTSDTEVVMLEYICDANEVFRGF